MHRGFFMLGYLLSPPKFPLSRLATLISCQELNTLPYACHFEHRRKKAGIQVDNTDINEFREENRCSLILILDINRPHKCAWLAEVGVA
jgi:hypothetical protein